MSGQDVDVATTALERAGSRSRTRPAAKCAPEDTVLEQDPPAGTTVDEGSTVTITVSLGMTVEVPSLRGRAACRRPQEARGREAACPTHASRPRRTSKSGSVITSEPPPGTEVECNSTVTLRRLEGPEPDHARRLHRPVQEVARSALERQGLIPDVDTRDADEPEGTVIGQDPGAGSELPRGER